MATAADARYDLAGLRQIASAAGLAYTELNIAAAIAMAESSGRPNAVSLTGDYGLWQINLRSWPQFSKEELLTVAGNARAMMVVARSARSWDHWVTFKNGKYKDYLSDGPKNAKGSFPVPWNLIPGLPGVVGLDPSGGLIDINPFDGDGVGLDLENPINKVTDAVGDTASMAADVAKDAMRGIATIALSLLIGAAALALVGLGISRLTANSKTGTAAAGLAAAGTGGLSAVASLT